MFRVVLNSLWLRRNKFVFDLGDVDKDDLVMSILMHVSEIVQGKSIIFDFSSAKPNKLEKKMVDWVFPEKGWFKVNCDGLVRFNLFLLLILIFLFLCHLSIRSKGC